MSARFWFALAVSRDRRRRPRFTHRPQPPARRGGGANPRRPPRSTTRPSSPSPSTTPISRSCATFAISRCARGTSDLHFMDIAATVNPATVHFRSLTEPSRVSVLEQNYEYDLLEPDKLLRKYVGRDVTLVRHAARRQHDARGRSEGAPAQLQQRAGLADRRRNRHRPAGRSHQVPRAARQSLLAADAHLDARQQRRHAAPRRGLVSGRQAVVERRLRADRRARRQGRRSRRLGDASSTAAARRSGTRSCSSSPAI